MSGATTVRNPVREYSGPVSRHSDKLRSECAALMRQAVTGPAKRHGWVAKSTISRARRHGEPLYQMARWIDNLPPDGAMRLAMYLVHRAEKRLCRERLCARQLTMAEMSVNQREDALSMRYIAGEDVGAELKATLLERIGADIARAIALGQQS